MNGTTLRELVQQQELVKSEIEVLLSMDIGTDEYEKELVAIEEKIVSKVENIDHYVTALVALQEQGAAYAAALKMMADNTMKKVESINKTEKRLMNYLMETGMISENKPLRTVAHTYFVQNTWGEVEIEDPSLIPQDYKKQKIEEVIDKSKIRKKLMSGEDVDGCKISKNKRVTRR